MQSLQQFIELRYQSFTASVMKRVDAHAFKFKYYTNPFLMLSSCLILQTGGLELFIETRGWFSCWCSLNKVWKHPFSWDNKTKHLTGADYDINSCRSSRYALDQAKLSRVMNHTFLSTLLVKEMYFDPFFQIVIYVYKHEFATATFLQREQPQSSRTNRQIVTTQRYQLLWGMSWHLPFSSEVE